MNINRVCFAGNLTGEPEVNYSPKGTAVVSYTIINHSFYGCAEYGVGRMEGQSDGNNYRFDRPLIDVHV